MDGKNRLKSILAKRTSPPAGKKTGAAKGKSAALEKLIQKQLKAGLSDLFKMKQAQDFGGGAASEKQTGSGMGRGGQFGGRQMEIAIDQMVASSLMHGKQTSGVMRALFGLVPSLIGR